jgi:hypothetical protein
MRVKPWNNDEREKSKRQNTSNQRRPGTKPVRGEMYFTISYHLFPPFIPISFIPTKTLNLSSDFREYHEKHKVCHEQR